MSKNSEEETNELQANDSIETFSIEEQTDGGFRWSINNGILTLEADGDYSGNYDGYPKWLEYASEIRTVIVLNVENVTNTSYLFYDCKNLIGVEFKRFDTSNVVDMHSMFWNCENLTDLDLSSLDTSNVQNMQDMFLGCQNLTDLDLSNFDTSNVQDMQHMFSGCESLVKLELSSFDTSNVKNMNSMFNNCGSLIDLDLSSFDTSKVTKMSEIFRGCASLTSLDLSNFDTSSTTWGNMESMFADCSNLRELIIPAKFSCKSNLPNNGFAWRDENGELCQTVKPNLSYTMVYSS